jgi:hypothetical protein
LRSLFLDRLGASTGSSAVLASCGAPPEPS